MTQSSCPVDLLFLHHVGGWILYLGFAYLNCDVSICYQGYAIFFLASILFVVHRALNSIFSLWQYYRCLGTASWWIKSVRCNGLVNGILWCFRCWTLSPNLDVAYILTIARSVGYGKKSSWNTAGSKQCALLLAFVFLYGRIWALLVKVGCSNGCLMRDLKSMFHRYYI